jgi:hypothetical protein
MKCKFYIKNIDLQLYNSKIVVIVGASAQELNNYVNEHITKIDISGNEGCVFENTTSTIYMYYVTLSKKFLSHNLIAHETFHLSSKIMENIEVQNEEAMAWLIGYLTDLIYAFLYENKLKVNNNIWEA